MSRVRKLILTFAATALGAVAAATSVSTASPASARAAFPGGLIAFARHVDNGPIALYVVRSNGTGLRRVSTEELDFDPAWTPDGKRLVFTSARDRLPNGIYVRDLAGGAARRLTELPPTTHAISPAVSPDGKVVAFVRVALADESQANIWQVDINGSGLRRLTATPQREGSPVFAAGPRRVLLSERNGWILTYGFRKPLVRGTQPAKAPRTGLLAFARAGGVYVTNGGKPVRVGSGSAPAWSHDGSRLVYAGADGLFTVKPDGTNRRRLTRTPAGAEDRDPAWQPVR